MFLRQSEQTRNKKNLPIGRQQKRKMQSQAWCSWLTSLTKVTTTMKEKLESMNTVPWLKPTNFRDHYREPPPPRSDVGNNTCLLLLGTWSHLWYIQRPLFALFSNLYFLQVLWDWLLYVIYAIKGILFLKNGLEKICRKNCKNHLRGNNYEVCMYNCSTRCFPNILDAMVLENINLSKDN
jgi:hypothetical protein